MSYRPKHEHFHDQLRRFDVRNGATMRLAFMCFYYRNHDSHYHDHVGWPEPKQHDMSCQMPPYPGPAPWLPRQKVYPLNYLEPINLMNEGYTDVYVEYEDDEIEQYLTTESYIDEHDVVRVQVTPNLPVFTDKPKEARFTAFIANSDGRYDAVCHGAIIILPGSPHREESENDNV